MMVSPRSAVLELNNVTHEYAVRRSMFEHRKLRAVDGVSLRVRKGDVLGVVGESGCGKTTLAKIMLGLIRPSAGEVLLEGKPIGQESRRSVARRVQFVFQDPYSSLNPRRRVGAIVAQPLVVHSQGDKLSRKKRVRELLDIVGLPNRAFDSYPGELSGGQRQRVAIARALALRPEILVCDEPTSSLDISVQAQILNLLLDLRSEFGLTYILISHNLNVIAHMATQVAVMYLGRIVEFDAAERLLAAPSHPYSRVLLKSAMTVAPRAGISDTRLTGTVPSPLDVPSGCRFHPRCPEAIPICSVTRPPSNSDGVSLVECHLVQRPKGRKNEALLNFEWVTRHEG